VEQVNGAVAVERLRLGDHVLFPFETDEEHREVVGTFVHDGLVQGHKVLHLTGESTTEYFAEAASMMPHDGQLAVLPVADTLFDEGAFCLDQALSLVHDAVERSLDEGYTGLRLSVEMTWARGDVKGCEQLIEFEQRVDEALPGSPVIGLCQYDRRSFPAARLQVLEGAHAGMVHAGAPLLDISALESLPGLRLCGEADLSSHAALAPALATPTRDLYLDLSGLAFADAATIRLLAETAMRYDRVVLVQPQPLFVQLLKLLGWDKLPNLQIVYEERG
jgi:anti-anti-sigma regulatory factor